MVKGCPFSMFLSESSMYHVYNLSVHLIVPPLYTMQIQAVKVKIQAIYRRFWVTVGIEVGLL